MPIHDAGSPPAPGIWLLLLAFLMVVWSPLAFGLEASAALGRLLSYGLPAILLLMFRVATTGLGIAAGRAIWAARPGAPTFARAWLVLDALASGLTWLTPYFPSNRTPGTRGPLLGALLAFNLAWIFYLSCSRRVRAIWPATVSD